MAGSRGSSRSQPGARASGGVPGSAGGIPTKNPTIVGDTITFTYPLSSVQRCLYCDTCFKNTNHSTLKNNYYRHIKDKHKINPGVRRNICSFCNSELGNKVSTHHCFPSGILVISSDEEYSHICEKCNETFPTYRGLSNHLTFHKSKEIQENFEANRKEKRSITTNKNRNIKIDTTHPHVFNEISNASRLSFPLDEGDGTSAGVKPIIVTSVNGYADLRIPTASDSAPVSNIDLRQEIASANANVLLTSTPDFNSSPPLQVLIPSTPPLQVLNDFNSPPLQDLNVLTDKVSSASIGVVQSNINPSDPGHELLSVVVNQDLAETIPKVIDDRVENRVLADLSTTVPKTVDDGARRVSLADTVDVRGPNVLPLLGLSNLDNSGSPNGRESIEDEVETDLGYPLVPQFEDGDGDPNVSNEPILDLDNDDFGVVDDDDSGADIGGDGEVRPTVLIDGSTWQEEFLSIFRDMHNDETDNFDLFEGRVADYTSRVRKELGIRDRVDPSQKNMRRRVVDPLDCKAIQKL